MDIITTEQITIQHLKKYWSIYVIDDNGNSKEIWNSRRILPFVPAGHTGTVIEVLSVRVPSLDNVDVQATVEHLRKIDPSDRIVGFPTQANAG